MLALIRPPSHRWQDASAALELCRAHARARAESGGSAVQLYCTVGVHPTRCDEFFLEGREGGKASASAGAPPQPYAYSHAAM